MTEKPQAAETNAAETTSSRLPWLWAPLVALQFLTRIPVNGVPDRAYDPPTRRLSLIFYPFVGLVVGAVGALVWIGTQRLGLPRIISAILTIAATVCLTGAFHEDGLADTADGLGPHSLARSLEVMRDSRIGTFGAVALWSILTLKAAALAYEPAIVWKVLLCAHVLARWSAIPLMRYVPQAQPEGLGAATAALVGAREVALASIAAVCLVCLIDFRIAMRCIAAAVLVAFATALFYRKRFGGVTGDCLGATNQLIEAAVLLTPFLHL